MQGLFRQPSELSDRLRKVLEDEADIMADISNQSARISEEGDIGFDEVEEIRLPKKRRTMTCTYNLKADRTG